MRFLLVHCHPLPESYNAALRQRAEMALARNGHAVEIVDLYAERFDPVLSAEERRDYLDAPERNLARVAGHVEKLKRAEGLIFVYPTWYYGPPAMLKGWFERTWLPGSAFEIPRYRGARARGALGNIRRCVCITTSGSPRWWLWLIGDPGRRLFTRGLRAVFHRRCKMTWLQLYNMNNAGAADRARFLDRVERNLGAIAP